MPTWSEIAARPPGYWQAQSGPTTGPDIEDLLAALLAAPGIPIALLPGSAAAPGLTVQGDTNTGLYAPAPDQLAVVTGGVQRALLSSTELALSTMLKASGRAIIASVAAPTDESGAYTMQVQATGNATLKMQGGASSSVYLGMGTVSDALAAGLALSNATGLLNIRAGNANRISVLSAGDVGIGTSSPTTRLHVDGPVRIKTYTVATLPSASAVGAGTRAMVTDALAPVSLQEVIGGGALMTPVYSDGAVWMVDGGGVETATAQRVLAGAAWRGGLVTGKTVPAMRLPEVQDLSDIQSGLLGEQFLTEWLRLHGHPVEIEMYNSAYLDLATAMDGLFNVHKSRRILFPKPTYYVRSPFPAANLRDLTLVSYTNGIAAPPTLVIENPLHTALSFGAASRDVRLEGVWSIRHLIKPDNTRYTANFDGCSNIYIETLVCANVAAAVRFANCDNIEIGTLVTDADTAISAASTATNVRIGRHIKTGAGANTVNGGQYIAIGSAGRGQWTPTATFATPGDLSVSYSNTDARWERIGRRLFIRGSITFTPTYTTASGALRIGGLPFPAAAGQDVFNIGLTAISSITWPSSATQMVLKVGGGLSYMDMIGLKSASAGNLASVGSFPSGSPYTIRFDGSYEVDA